MADDVLSSTGRNVRAFDRGPAGSEKLFQGIVPMRRGWMDYEALMQALTTSSAVVTADVVFLEGLLVTNDSDVDAWITLTNTAGDKYLSEWPLAARESRTLFFPSMKMVGIKWFASATSVRAQLWGSQ